MKVFVRIDNEENIIEIYSNEQLANDDLKKLKEGNESWFYKSQKIIEYEVREKWTVIVFVIQ